MIILNSKVVICILVYIIIPSIILIGIKKNNKNEILEINSTLALKGVFAIYVAIHNYVQKIINPGVLNPINQVGFLCVSFFFLMSGFGLTIGYIKDKMMKGYFKKRILRLYFLFGVANIIIGILYNVLLHREYQISEILIKSFTMRTVYSNVVLWYILVQTILYLIFYVSFKVFKNNKVKILSVIIMTIIYTVITKK